MPAYKNENGSWYISFYYKDLNGKNIKKKKTGFATKKEALQWERRFLDKKSGNLNMSFDDFVEVYTEDMKPRLRYNTWITKEHVIEQKILPYFGDRNISEIEASDIIKWQNKMIDHKKPNGKGFSDTYLRTINNQMSAIFNHAVRFYNLSTNPVRKAGSMGKDRSKEMLIWTKEDYMKFSEVIKDNKNVYHVFEILYWCGLRIGELLALTGGDFNLDEKTITISKSFQRLKRNDYITPPKTEKSNRTVIMPDFLCDELKIYFKSLKKAFKPTKRIFNMSKNYLYEELRKAAAIAGVNKIRIHDLRHSHVSLLIFLGFSAVDIADRMGHESIDITLHYAHMFPSRQSEMAERLNDELKKLG